VRENGQEPALPVLRVPESTPDEERDTPVGSGPVSEKLGAGSPEACSWIEMLEPAVTFAVNGGVTTGSVPVW
jgi:hypothetical protein